MDDAKLSISKYYVRLFDGREISTTKEKALAMADEFGLAVITDLDGNQHIVNPKNIASITMPELDSFERQRLNNIERIESGTGDDV